MNSNASTAKRAARIAVLVSVGRHPVSGTQRYSRNDAAALTLATSLAARHHASLDVIHAGDPTNAALREYLALGAAKVEVLSVAEGDEIAPSLSVRLKGYDLILTGTRAEGTQDSGMLPYQLADAPRHVVACIGGGHRGRSGPRDGPAIPAERFAPPRAGEASGADRRASDGHRHAALRVRKAARRHHRKGASQRRQRIGQHGMVHQTRDRKTGPSGRCRETLGTRAHALRDDD